MPAELVRTRERQRIAGAITLKPTVFRFEPTQHTVEGLSIAMNCVEDAHIVCWCSIGVRTT